MQSRVMALRHDIINCTSHVFGQHDRCADYFCKGTNGKQNDVNLVPALVSANMWTPIQKLVDRLANQSRSMIFRATNNLCETLNSVVAKYLNGKRINYARNKSFGTRCRSAVISLNSSCHFQGRIHKATTGGFSPGK